MTTLAGLYRYRLGDVVRVVDRAGSTPVFEFDHRIGDVLDLVGEKTSGWHTQEAMLNIANAMLGSARAVIGYTVTADTEATPYRYRLYVELAGDVDVAHVEPRELAVQFDQQLRQINRSYQTIGRVTGRLGMPEVVLVRSGTFSKLEEQQYKSGEGVSRNQTKVPGVLRNPEHIALLEANARDQLGTRLH
jgi:hypothetical protein